MGRLAQRIADRRMLRLIRCYLEAGILAGGVTKERHEGTPQGGPLSPLLANVLLDEVDRELEKRGHAFVRYADDCNVYVRSRRAGERVLETLRRIYAQLRLKISEAKSAVARPWLRKFLGFSFWAAPGGVVRLRVAPEALKAMKEQVRRITGRSNGRSIESVATSLRDYLRGWKEYFRPADGRQKLTSIDKWIRRRLRMVQLKQWKQGPTAYRELRARGVPEREAAWSCAHARSWWRTSKNTALGMAMPTSYFDRIGIPRLAS
jgi:RNA-directed DNA polymerase